MAAFSASADEGHNATLNTSLSALLPLTLNIQPSMGNRLLPFGDRRALDLKFLTPALEEKAVKVQRWGPGGKAFYPYTVQLPEGIDRKDGATSGLLTLPWSKKVGWESLLNRAGTTFRQLSDADKQGLDEKKAIALMIAQPSLIKRPVVDLGGDKLLVGFKPEIYAAAFKR